MSILQKLRLLIHEIKIDFYLRLATTTEAKVLVGAQIFALILLAYCLVNQNHIDGLVEANSRKRFFVVNTDCPFKGSGRVLIQTEKGNVFVSTGKSQCEELEKGDSILVYYSVGLDYFHLPLNPHDPKDSEYQRGIMLLVLFFGWSVIPWKRIFVYFRWMLPKPDRIELSKDLAVRHVPKGMSNDR